MIDNVMLNSPACGKGRFQHLINVISETLKQVQGDATKVDKVLNNN